MNTAPLVVLADIHGNLWALDAVLKDIERRGLQRIVNLGDSVYGPLLPAETAERLMRLDIPSIRGNQDRIIVDPLPETEPVPVSLAYVKDCLQDPQLRWIAATPPTRVVDDTFFLCHGTPDSDETYLLEEVTPHGVGLKDDAALLSLLQAVPQPVILCAHSHLARTVALSNGQLIVNPGSVGLPAYSDDLPVPHKMEAGTTHARYAVLTPVGGEWLVEHVLVPYDATEAIRMARANQRPDWAGALTTGRAVTLA